MKRFKEGGGMKEITLNAPAMSCGHCKMSIESAGNARAGISAITADPDTKQVRVSYDEGVISLADIKAMLADAGYPAE